MAVQNPFTELDGSRSSSTTSCKKCEVFLTLEGEPLPNAFAYTWPYPDGDTRLAIKTPLFKLHMYTKKNSIGWDFKVIRFGPRNSKEILSVAGLADRQTHKLTWMPNYMLHSTNLAENGAWIVTGNFLIHDGPDTASPNDLIGTAGCLEVFGPNGFSVFNQKMLELSGEDNLHKIKATILYKKSIRPKWNLELKKIEY
ncbi:hypothetical protein [Acinetobacter gerneri]|uniref:hypothetical protein n=1 Tax=Acinetobacter gerneri TaxID=202952 RepID=UPI0028AB60B5|nr:hypothetical protein [Acinetobacter gerneri]